MANARLDSLDTDIFFTLYKAQTVDEKTRNLKKESDKENIWSTNIFKDFIYANRKIICCTANDD